MAEKTRHPNQDIIEGILAVAKPNPALLSKSQLTYNVSEQLKKESRFYEKIHNPFSDEPIKNIEDLNKLITQFDSSSLYNFQSMLPNGAIERTLSEKYNLALNERNKFSEEEQKDIKGKLQILADEAAPLLLENGLADSTEQTLLHDLVIAMSAINIKNGNMVIFTSASDFKQSLGKFKNLDIKVPKELEAIKISSNIAGSKSTSKRSGTNIIKTDTNIEFEINPDLNAFSHAAFDALYKWAKEKEENFNDQEDSSIKNKLGKGTLSPMSVSTNEWRQDVFDAVMTNLSGYNANLINNLNQNNGLQQLFNKYNVAGEIALGRSLVTLRGFLGELRAILLVDAMFPGASASLLGTAKVTLTNSLKGGEDAPLDLMVKLGEMYGIQVKNTSDMYSYSWGNKRSKEGMPITSFYVERLQEAITDEEKNFFGAYSYNQPINLTEYTDVYSGFQAKFGEFAAVYKKLALYIIRQMTSIKESSSQYLTIGQIQNDFFIMNNKIVPTSALYQAMNTNDSNLINSSFSFGTSSKGYYSPTDPIPGNYINYAAQVWIKYDINVKYANLLQSAYNMT